MPRNANDNMADPLAHPPISRHPAGLRALFFTEMWERFSYYGMRALLVLYLVNALEFPRADALEVYATYTALVYLTPILGGYLADRWLGTRCAVLTGAVVMALGHFAMAFPDLLYVGLGLLVVGNGFFKPNISTMVGALYEENDPRRDSGFTLFYMGINLGAFFSPLVCGTLGEKFGWHYGFAAAGVGMIIGLLVFSRGQSQLGSAGMEGGTVPRAPAAQRAGLWRHVVALSAASVGVVLAVIQVWQWISPTWQALSTWQRAGMATVIALVFFAAPRAWDRLTSNRRAPRVAWTRVERDRVLAIGIMAVFVVFFWMGFEQAGGTMNLFADQLTDRMVSGWEVPASYFQAVNPLFIILLAPLFSMLWMRLDRSRFGLSSVAKQGLGMIILGLGFIILAMADERAQVVGKVGPAWLLMVYLLHTVGELCLSPIGLSMVTKLAPARLAAMMMGLWFVAIAAANYLAGTLEALLQASGIPLYWFLVSSSLGAGALLLLLSPWIGRLMHGVR